MDQTIKGLRFFEPSETSFCQNENLATFKWKMSSRGELLLVSFVVVKSNDERKKGQVKLSQCSQLDENSWRHLKIFISISCM